MKLRLLVIEDNAALREMLREALSVHGFEVWAATDAAEAFRGLQGHPVDVILADLNIPGVSGLEFCRLIRQQNVSTAPAVPVWIMTGADVPDLMAEAHAAGAAGVFFKPFNVGQAAACLRATALTAGHTGEPNTPSATPWSEGSALPWEDPTVRLAH